MGFQWRKRTKGKNAWFNFSLSKGRGFGSSFSVKLGKITVNAGSGGRRRSTINFGNGLRFVKTRTAKPKKQEPKVYVERPIKANDIREPVKLTQGEAWFGIGVLFIIIFIIQLIMRAFK